MAVNGTGTNSSTELLIDIGYGFYDAGYWKQLAGLPVSDLRLEPRSGDIVPRYFGPRCWTARRTGGAQQALQGLEPLESMRNLMGRQALSFDLEVAYLSEISGNYREPARSSEH